LIFSTLTDNISDLIYNYFFINSHNITKFKIKDKKNAELQLLLQNEAFFTEKQEKKVISRFSQSLSILFCFYLSNSLHPKIKNIKLKAKHSQI
jgi:hypothetical protein